jgi:hypothetical protein
MDKDGGPKLGEFRSIQNSARSKIIWTSGSAHVASGSVKTWVVLTGKKGSSSGLK